MAQPNTITGTQLLIEISDGGSPVAYVHPCLINAERGITFSSDTNQEVVPDCDNPDDPGWKLATKDGMSVEVTGSGKLDLDSVVEFDAWFRADTAKAIRIYLGEHGYWLGNFKLSTWQVTGARGSRADCSITLVSDGEVGTYVPASP